MTFPIKVFDRQVDSWDERCPYRISVGRSEANGGYDILDWKEDLIGGGANWQLIKLGEWISKNLTGLWSSHTTGSSNVFHFEKEADAMLFRLYI